MHRLAGTVPWLRVLSVVVAAALVSTLAWSGRVLPSAASAGRPGAEMEAAAGDRDRVPDEYPDLFDDPAW